MTERQAMEFAVYVLREIAATNIDFGKVHTAIENLESAMDEPRKQGEPHAP